jgi:hypothetical protein
MAKKDKAMSALEAVHAALKPLKPEDRQRVLSSVRALLDVSPQSSTNALGKSLSSIPPSSVQETVATSARKTSIRELIQDKKPSSSPEFITLFAYYREKYENLPTFARADLQKYYGLSKENPPANYDRDFVNAVRKGWIHEDDENSYITSKGIEAVESGFSSTGNTKPRKGQRSGK